MLKLIPKHNQNIRDANKILKDLSTNLGLLDDITTKDCEIRSVFKIFFSKRYIKITYNKLVERYNDIVGITNLKINEINNNNSIYLAYKKRLKELKIQKSKLLLMCQKIKKPDNFDYCVYLSGEKNHYESWLNSYFGKQAFIEKELITNKLQEIENLIKSQNNFDYNMNLLSLYRAYDHLVETTKIMSENMEELRQDISKRKNKIHSLNGSIKELKMIIDKECDLLKQFGIDTNKISLKKCERIENVKPHIIDDDMISSMISSCRDVSYLLTCSECSLKEWMKTCNKFIKIFNVDFIDQNILPKYKEDNEPEEILSDYAYMRLYDL